MSRKHILVADDEQNALLTMQFILEVADYSVTTAKDGKEALSKILEARKGSKPVDLLITDIQMPGLTGLELMDELNRLRIDVPVLAVTGYGASELVTELMNKGQLEKIKVPLMLQPRIWYNPAMQSSVFYLPGFIGIVLQNITIILTSLALVREREQGTIEQLNISPLRRGELITGKLIPYIVIGYTQVILILVTAVVVFGMPMRGNVPLLLGLSSFFLMFSLALGLLISALSQNQFQAMQASFMALVPTIFLSGFIFPVESMPKAAQWIAALVPLTYYLRILRGIVVKGSGIESLWQDTVILAVMGVLTLVLATVRVRKSLA